jgi:hypothetical protein
MGKPFLLLPLRAAYPEMILLRSAFELAAGIQTVQAGQNAPLALKRCVSSSGYPGCPRCPLKETVLPNLQSISLNTKWNYYSQKNNIDENFLRDFFQSQKVK